MLPIPFKFDVYNSKEYKMQRKATIITQKTPLRVTESFIFRKNNIKYIDINPLYIKYVNK